MTGNATSPASDAILHGLESLRGQPVRITVIDPKSRERLTRITGILSSVKPTGLTVECLQSAPLLPASAPVTLEVLAKGSVFWYQSSLWPNPEASRDQVYLHLPSQAMSIQRRRYPRVDLEVPLHLVAKANGRAYSAVLRDISAGGASFECAERVPDGERITMVFALGSGLFFRDLEGETIRSTQAVNGGYIMALRFCCGQEEERALADWVTRQFNV